MLIEPTVAAATRAFVWRPAVRVSARAEKKRAPEGARCIGCGTGGAGAADRGDQNRWIMPTRKPSSSRPSGFEIDAPVTELVALRYGLMPTL